MSKTRPRTPKRSAKRRKAKAKPAIQRLTHGERYARREQMAAKVKAGASIESVAREFQVTVTWVQSVCREFGVKRKAGQ